MERFATPALVLGLVGLAVSGVLWVYRPAWTGAWPAALIVGGLLVLFGLYASFSSFRGLWGRRTTRYGLNALVMVGLVLGIIALVEAVSYRHSWRLDLTQNRRHSLAPQTVKVLKELRVPVKAVAFLRPDQPGKRTTQDLLERYASRSEGRLAWEIVDPDRNPLLAKRYEVGTYGTVVLEVTTPDGQARRENVLDPEEEKLTNALIRVTREGKRVIYLVEGHGERNPAGTEQTGLGQVKSALEKLNYEVKQVLLAREPKVPDDAALVVVAGPQKDLLQSELDALHAYLGRAGKLLLLVDPFQAPGLGGFLERYGLGLGADVIIEDNPQARVLGFGPEIPVVGDYQSHAITRDFQLATLFPVARSVVVREKPPEGVTAQGLARTSSQSWAEPQERVRGGAITPPPASARRPQTIAAVATVDAKTPPEGRKDAKARIVVVGDSDFATNAFVNLSGNRDFLLNTLSWLAEEENLIAIRPRESPTQPVFLSETEGYAVFLVSVVMIPAVMVVAGVSVWVRKRTR